MSVEASTISVSTPARFFRQRYLFAFATQAELMNYLKTQMLEEEESRHQEILNDWLQLRTQVESLILNELNYADTIQLTQIPDEHAPRLTEFASDPLFQRSFSGARTTFELVEVDKLVAAQRAVNLDFVDQLTASYSQAPTLAELLDICLSPRREKNPVQHLEVAPNQHIFTSPNADARFLGSFVKHLTAEDLDYPIGGIPAAAIISFVGYGCTTVNAIKVRGRLILNNGFHRVFALRSLGVTQVPMVIQHVNNPELELPPAIANLPTQYLIGVPRPVLIKDFFEPGFAITLKVRERVQMVAVSVNYAQHGVPL